MLRAVAKGAGLAVIGRLPGGPAAYRALTRKHMGTGASHIRKLLRVWPEYAEVWRELRGRSLEGARIRIHEGGVTPFSPFAAYLLTGSAGAFTSSSETILNRYTARSVNAVLSSAIELDSRAAARRPTLEACRWCRSATDAIAALDGEVHRRLDLACVPLPSASADLCHSGGALEHYRADALEQFLRECYRILKPGGIASHVVDHRDHLVHADGAIPFSAHLALPEPAYRILFDNPLAYHNRLSPTEVAARFVAAGFERITIRRLILPHKAFVDHSEVSSGRPGLPRKWLARRFREISDVDLNTAAAHYLYRRPLRGNLVDLAGRQN